MTFIPADYSYPSSRPWVYGIVVLLVITLMGVPIVHLGTTQLVSFETFYNAGVHFLNDLDPYGVYEGFDYYKMSPTFLIVMIGFAKLPFLMSALLWQIVSISLFFIALIWLMRQFALQEALGLKLSLFLPFLLLTDFQLNGTMLQSNTIMISVTMLGFLFYTQGRYVLAAILIAFAANMKIYPLVLMLLLFLDLRWKFVFTSIFVHIVLLFLPFLVFGVSQANALYQSWFYLLTMDKNFVYEDWVHHFLSLKPFLEANFNLILKEEYIYVLLLSALSVGIPALWLRMKSGYFSNGNLFLLLAVSMSWILLFSTRTEGGTLVVIAPVYAYILWWAMSLDVVKCRRLGLFVLISIFMITSMSTSDVFRGTIVHALSWQHNLRTIGLMLAFLLTVSLLWKQALSSRKRDDQVV